MPTGNSSLGPLPVITRLTHSYHKWYWSWKSEYFYSRSRYIIIIIRTHLFKKIVSEDIYIYTCTPHNTCIISCAQHTHVVVHVHINIWYCCPRKYRANKSYFEEKKVWKWVMLCFTGIWNRNSARNEMQIMRAPTIGIIFIIAPI